MKSKRNVTRLAAVAALGLMGVAIDTAHAAISLQTGGSGYSGTLSSRRAIREQQLNDDPATPGAVNSPTAQGAPRRGSSSLTYDASMVTLSRIRMGEGYGGAGRIEVQGEGGTFLQDLAEFLESPAGPETGYVQVFYRHGNLPPGVEFPALTFFGPPGEPSRIPVEEGFITYDRDGPIGFDTHAFFFKYRDGVPDDAVAHYSIFADTGTRGNSPDFLVGMRNGQEFTLGPGDLAPANVAASLVPLPPAALAGGAMLVGMGVRALRRRQKQA